MTRSELMALAERLSAARVYGRDIEQAADFLRQIAQAQPVGTVAQNSFDQHHTVLDERGNVKSWTRKGPHAAPLLFRELEVGTSLYTLPLED